MQKHGRACRRANVQSEQCVQLFQLIKYTTAVNDETSFRKRCFQNWLIFYVRATRNFQLAMILRLYSS